MSHENKSSHPVSPRQGRLSRLATAGAGRRSLRCAGLKLWDDPGEGRYPMPVLVEGQDECYVGRVREDLSQPNALNFWVVGDQLRKGAALNGIQIAELLIR